jgi:hypothetical protein
MPYFVVVEDRVYQGGGDASKYATFLFKLSNGVDWMEICTVSDVPNVRFSPAEWLDVCRSVTGLDAPFSDHIPSPETKIRAELLEWSAATHAYDGTGQKLPLEDSKIVVDDSIALGFEVGVQEIEKLFDEHIVFETDDASYCVFIAKQGRICIVR